jgi:hypothetical protein
MPIPDQGETLVERERKINSEKECFDGYKTCRKRSNTGSFTMCGKKGKAGTGSKVKTFNQIAAVESTASS